MSFLEMLFCPAHTSSLHTIFRVNKIFFFAKFSEIVFFYFCILVMKYPSDQSLMCLSGMFEALIVFASWSANAVSKLDLFYVNLNLLYAMF